MSKFERFRPLKVPELPEIELFSETGISPSDAGREDAKEAMVAAKAILEKVAKELKLAVDA